MVFLVLKTARYVDPIEVVELGEILIFLGRGLHHHRAPRRGELAPRGAAATSSTTGAPAPRPGRRAARDPRPRGGRLQSGHRRASRRTSSEVEAERLLGPALEPGRAHLQAQARGAPVQARRRPAGGSDRPLARGPLRAGAPGGAQLLPRRERPPDARPRAARRVAATCSQRAQANLAQVAVRQNEDMRKISAWVAIIAVPTAIAGIYGMNFEHMPELAWTLRLSGRAGPDGHDLHGLYLFWRFKRAGWLSARLVLAAPWRTTASSARSWRASRRRRSSRRTSTRWRSWTSTPGRAATRW